MEELHGLLLDLAGRFSDSALYRCRDMLALGQITELPTVVAEVAAAHDVSLSPDEIEMLGRHGVSGPVLESIPTEEPEDPFPFMFKEFPSSGVDEEEQHRLLDETVVRVAMGEPGVRGLWRAWRLADPASEQWPEQKVVYIAETLGDPVSLAAGIARGMLLQGETAPAVETYRITADLPYYQRTARLSGQLLWHPPSNPEFKLARVYDEVDPESGPRFLDTRARILNEAEASRVVSYLMSGEPLLVSTVQMADVVDPARGEVVPMNFYTNGEWIWPDTIAYYLAEHKLEPDSELLASIRTADYTHPELDSVLLQKAFDFLWNPPARD